MIFRVASSREGDSSGKLTPAVAGASLARGTLFHMTSVVMPECRSRKGARSVFTCCAPPRTFKRRRA